MRSQESDERVDIGKARILTKSVASRKLATERFYSDLQLTNRKVRKAFLDFGLEHAVTCASIE